MCSSIKNAPHIVFSLLSVAATPPFMFLIVREDSIFQPIITLPIPSLYPGNSPAFNLVPQLYPAINPPSPIPHPICPSIHQSHQSLGPDFPGATFPHPLPSPLSMIPINSHQSLGPDFPSATFPPFPAPHHLAPSIPSIPPSLYRPASATCPGAPECGDN